MRKAIIGLSVAIGAILVLFYPGVEAQQALNIGAHAQVQSFSVTNGSATNIFNPLGRANFVQLSIIPSGAQAFTYCKPLGDCLTIPSGQTYELGPLRDELASGQLLGTVQTATSSTTLQVEAQRVR